MSSASFQSCCSTESGCSPTGARLPLFRLALGLFVAAQTMMLGMTVNLTEEIDTSTRGLLNGGMLLATLLVLILLGWPLAVGAVRQLLARQLTMELLFIAGILAAFGLSLQAMLTDRGAVYFEVVNVLLIVYSVGRAITLHSRHRALTALTRFTNQIATARRVDRSVLPPPKGARESVVPVDQIVCDDLVRVVPGELIPIDGQIVAGSSLVHQTAFTGEWTSAPKRPGDTVLAGTACLDGALLLRATAPGKQRRIDQLADLIDAARRSPTALQRQADRFVRLFLPLVALIALATTLYWWRVSDSQTALYNGLAVLLVACPCAAGLATPLALWSVLGHLAARGLVVRSADALERLAAVDGVIFDKTGTLGDDHLVLHDVQTPGDAADRSRILAILSAIERHSAHPVALALRHLPTDPVWNIDVNDLHTLPARGIEAQVLVHNDSLSHRVRLTRATANAPQSPANSEQPATSNPLVIDAHLDGQFAARALFGEHLRGTASVAVEQLRALDLDVQIMTGDATASAAAGLAPFTPAMTPEQKHDAVIRLRHDSTRRLTRPLFVGDGLNDAAAMAASYVSFALSSGSEVALQTASATLHQSDLTLIPQSIALSRQAVRVIRSNFTWAVAYNTVGILAATTGYLHPILAAVLMGFSSAIVAFRSSRIVSSEEEGPGEEKTRRAEGTKAPRHQGTKGAESPAPSLGASVPPSLRASSVAPSPPLPLSPSSSRSVSPLAYSLFHVTGLLGQGLLLIRIAELSAPPAFAVLIGLLLLALFLHHAAAWLPAWGDMVAAMISLGGLGMNLGWWLDLDFASAIHDGQALSCCGPPLHDSHGALIAYPLMYIGMLAFGVPAMYLLRRTPEIFSLKRWCCLGPLLIGIPAMCLGMHFGGVFAARHPFADPHLQVLNDYALMMLGMAGGMVVPHALELLAWKPDAEEA